jgi:poly(3-hydroxybutyrate) depolymerase
MSKDNPFAHTLEGLKDDARVFMDRVHDELRNIRIPHLNQVYSNALDGLPELALIHHGHDHGPEKISKAGNYDETLVVDGVPRHYRLHVPPNYDPDRPMPLLVALHGHGQDGKDLEDMSGIDARADKEGFIVAYPDAIQWFGKKELSAWDTGNGLVPPGAHADDVGFLRQLIETSQKTMNIDDKRIYMVGISNGGMEAYKAASELSDKVAAVVSVSGAMSGLEQKPDKPVSMMSIVGTNDDVVPPTGRTEQEEIAAVAPQLVPLIGEAVPALKKTLEDPVLQQCIIPKVADYLNIAPQFLPVEYATDFWKKSNGITGDAQQVKNGDVTTQLWTDSKTGVAVEQQVVRGADHVLQHGIPADYSLTDEALQFLQAHPKVVEA